jgi:hypothetical protein
MHPSKSLVWYGELSTQHDVYGSVQSYDWLKCITWQPDIIHIPPHVSYRRGYTWCSRTLTDAAIWWTEIKRVYYLWGSIIGRVELSTDLDAPRPSPGNAFLSSKTIKTTKKLFGFIKCHAGNLFWIYRRENPDRKNNPYYLWEKSFH